MGTGKLKRWPMVSALALLISGTSFASAAEALAKESAEAIKPKFQMRGYS